MGKLQTLAAHCTVSREQAFTAFVNWLAAYKYTPLEVLAPSLLNDVQLVNLPYYHFVTNYHADYSVNIGDIEREPRTVYKTVYEDGRSKQVPHTEWVLKTKWRPYLTTGSVTGSFAMKYADNVPVGGEFLAFANDAAWHSGELAATSDTDCDGETLPFTRSPQEAYTQVAKDVLGREISKRVREALPGDTQRELKYKWYLSGDQWSRIYLPYWRFSFEHMSTTYVSLIDGRRIDRINGLRPTDIELRRSVNENLRPLWIALSLGLVIALLIWWVGGAAAIVPWLLGSIAVVVSGVGILSLKRRYDALSSARLSRTEVVEKLLHSLTSDENHSDPKAIERRDGI